jgi:hypothetical protein
MRHLFTKRLQNLERRRVAGVLSGGTAFAASRGGQVACGNRGAEEGRGRVRARTYERILPTGVKITNFTMM